MHILLVENSEPVRRELCEFLRGLSVVEEVTAVAGVAEARESLGSRAFDLWVLDFELGDGTALDLLPGRPDRPDVRPGGAPAVVVLTQHTSRLVRDRCLVEGADRFIDKLAVDPELESAVLEAAERRRRMH